MSIILYTKMIFLTKKFNKNTIKNNFNKINNKWQQLTFFFNLIQF